MYGVRHGERSPWPVAKCGKSVAERRVMVWRLNVRENIVMEEGWTIDDARFHGKGTSKWTGAG